MPEFAIVLTSLALGWLLGKAFLYLMHGRDKGSFTAKHWLTLIASVASAMLFAKYGIGVAVRNFQINDAVVGVSGIAALVAFAVITLHGSRSNRV